MYNDNYKPPKHVFKYEAENHCFELEDTNVHLPDIMQSFRMYLLAIGFSPKNVDEYIEAD